jgi:ribosome-associated protein
MDKYKDTDPEFVSKSQRKRDMHKLQDLGEQLEKLSAKQLEKMDLPDALRQAISEVHSIHSRSAQKRQRQYIGRLMRDVDPIPIKQHLVDLLDQSRHASHQLHQIEHWRDKLLKDGDSALSELLKEHPKLDRQHLRQLMRSAHKEKLNNTPPRAVRALLKYMRDILFP